MCLSAGQIYGRYIGRKIKFTDLEHQTMADDVERIKQKTEALKAHFGWRG